MQDRGIGSSPGQSQPKGRGSIPWGLLGMLALVALGERAVASREGAWVGVGVARYRFVSRALDREARGCDVLILGDSVAKHGVLPRVLEERTGRRSYNFGLNGGMPLYADALLRRALAAGARPSTVVVAFDPTTLRGTPRTFPRMLAEVLEPIDLLAFARTARDASAFAETLLDRWLPSVRNRFEVRAVLRGEPQHGAPAFVRNWDANLGSEVRPPGPLGEDRDPPNPAAFYSPRDWCLHPLNRVYLDRLLGRARAHGIRVVWLIEPNRAPIARWRDAVGINARLDALARARLSGDPNLTILDARRSGYPDVLFSDSIHVNADGASALTLALADHLASPSPSRLVDLPPPRPSRPSRRFETLVESSWAVRSDRSRR